MAAEAVDMNSDVNENENAEASPNTITGDDNDDTVTATVEGGGVDNNNNGDSEDDSEDDLLVRETIEAGRGDRDEQGVRDQWHSDEHIGEDSKFDSRKPISKDVQRLLRVYRLECDGCDHKEAVKKVNAYVRETKRLTKQLEEKERQQQQQQQRRDAWVRRIFTTIVVVGLSCAYMYRTKLSEVLEIIVEKVNGGGGGGGDGLAGFSEAQRSEILRLRRQYAADAATKRQQQETVPPTWLDNEKKEVWTSKQEKQFQKALREFGGVSKKERYQLIAAKVDGKSRIECLTHHRMQELLEKQQQQQQQQQ